MSEWQPIETAPNDTVVLLGRYRSLGGKHFWDETVAVAWETEKTWWGKVTRKRTWEGENHSHWTTPLAPPSDAMLEARK